MSTPAAPPPTPVPQRSRMGPGVIALIVFGVLGCFAIPVVALLAGMLLPALAKAKGKASEIRCVNNLKQLGLAAQIYAVENAKRMPGSWIQVTNEISATQILVCPVDGTHSVAPTWAAFTDAHVSYPLDSKGVTTADANRVIAHCPIHAHVLLANGSVIQGFRGQPGAPLVEQNGSRWLGASPKPDPSPNR